MSTLTCLHRGSAVDSHVCAMQEVGAYMRMARPHNILPSLLLVFLGAWAGAGRSPAALGSPTVWGMAAISAGTPRYKCL
jgi:4-hydroxybenzoate polyprenyltransferase